MVHLTRKPRCLSDSGAAAKLHAPAYQAVKPVLSVRRTNARAGAPLHARARGTFACLRQRERTQNAPVSSFPVGSLCVCVCVCMCNCVRVFRSPDRSPRRYTGQNVPNDLRAPEGPGGGGGGGGAFNFTSELPIPMKSTRSLTVYYYYYYAALKTEKDSGVKCRYCEISIKRF